MITDSVRFDKEKNNLPLRRKIVETVTKHPRYRNDIYDVCRRVMSLSRTEFRQLLEEMHINGEIYINENGVVLPERPQSTVKVIQTTEPSKQRKKPPEENKKPPEPDENSPNDLLIHCLVNRSRVFKEPQQKKYLDDPYYAHRNYSVEQIPLDRVFEQTLLKGFQFVPGEFTENPDPDIGIRTGENWHSQRFFLVEFDNIRESTLAEFIANRPFLQQNAWFVGESLRSGYDDPEDATCNGRLRTRTGLCMPDTVKTTEEREWIYEALEKALPDCDDGSANSITNGGLGNVNGAYVKIGKIVDTDWFHTALETGRQKKAEAEKAERERAEERERKRRVRATMGFTEREGEIPLEALAKSDPDLFLESLGLSLKSEKGRYQKWGRTEKRGDIALSVWRSAHDNWQIRVFANSIPTPPGVSRAMSFTRFYCYHEFSRDIEGLQPDSDEWKDINARLATHGYGTWLSDAEFKAQLPKSRRSITGNGTYGPSSVNEPPSYKHFTPEDRQLISACGYDPYATFITGTDGKRQDIWTPQYENLHPMTGRFARNGEPPETQKHRVYNTIFKTCPKCGGYTAFWIDRFRLRAGMYCEGCHKDTWLNSYLSLELRRKIKDAIISDFPGYVSEDPVWADYALWKIGQITQLGSGMNTGKTTFVTETGVKRCKAEGKMFIICVPRISLARSLFSHLNKKYGSKSFGLFHEGSRHKFIGNIGAICCLSSLPKVFEKVEKQNIDASEALIFIDEIDYAYQLTTLVITQARKTKRILTQALHSNGLVLAGQTEYTASLESLAAELASESILAYYKNAEHHGNSARIIEYPEKVEDKSALALAGFLNSIEMALFQGKNAYSFCSERRQVAVAETLFSEHRPVTYTALSKGLARANQFLIDQKLVDTSLFLGTGAASVGISILDEQAVTRILLTLVNGHLHVADAVQKAVRDRGLHDVEIHFLKYQLALPVAPTDAKTVSLFDMEMKRQLAAIEDPLYAQLVKHAEKLAITYALNSLAEQEVHRYIEYHLGEVAGFDVTYAAPPIVSDAEIKQVKQIRSDSLREEKEIKKVRARNVIKEEMQRDCTHEYQPPSLLCGSDIRKLAIEGMITEFSMLGHLTANAAAKSIGFDDIPDTVRGSYDDPKPFRWNESDLVTIKSIVENELDPEKLSRQIHGYIATHRTQWIIDHTTGKLIDDVEWSAISDYRFIGTVLQHLIHGLQGKNFKATAFKDAVMDILRTKYADGTLLSNIQKGALGISHYRKARFIGVSDDVDPVKFVVELIQDYYPIDVLKTDGFYTLRNVPNRDMYIFENALNCWLGHNASTEHPPQRVAVKPIVDILTPKEENIAAANELAKQGKLVKEIIKETGLSEYTVRKETRDTRYQRDTEWIAEAKQMRANKMSYRAIGKKLGKAPNTIKKWVNHD